MSQLATGTEAWERAPNKDESVNKSPFILPLTASWSKFFSSPTPGHVVAQRTWHPWSWTWSSCLDLEVLGVKHGGLSWGLPGTYSTVQVPASRRHTKLYVPHNLSTTFPTEKPCVPCVTVSSQKRRLHATRQFLQVSDFNCLFSGHLILQAPDICKCNIANHWFPQAPLYLAPELLPPHLTTAWLWQRGEQPLTSSILCDCFQHPNPWVTGDCESLLGITTALQPAIRELHFQKEHEFRLASSFQISYLLALAVCSKRAGLSPFCNGQPCSPPRFHRSPGHQEWRRSQTTLCCCKTLLLSYH